MDFDLSCRLIICALYFNTPSDKKQLSTKLELSSQHHYRFALQREERLEFAQEKEHQNDFSRDKGQKMRFHQGILEVITELSD